ncbi:hypothetical protein FCOIX_11539 [Fusarium coicis]|nr:hypothetical protein FCOIX_11539 [Fusarium coicis]
MAIIEGVPELSVSIVTEGKEADEYDFGHKDEQVQHKVPTIRRFIEAQSGSKYSISYRISPNFPFKNRTDILILQIYVNGARFNWRSIRKSDLGGSEYCGQVPSQDSKRQGQVEAFIFSPMQPIEDASRQTVDKDMGRVKRMGSVQIIVDTCKVELIKDPKPSQLSPSSSPYIAQEALSKSSRGVTHTTLYKTSRSVRLTNKQKVAVFRFRYVSRDSIIRRSIKLNSQAPDRITSQPYKVTIRFNGKTEINLTDLE